MKYICNPVNLEYKYQFFKVNPEKSNLCEVHREAADPTLISFKGKYYLFTSMSAGFYMSDDLCIWKFHPFGKEIPCYDYAPDVCVIGEYIYLSASKANENCSFYRTKDPVNNPFEEIKGIFPFWDPHLFLDDDGRLYFYWGCSNLEPIYGIELDPVTMQPIGEKCVIVEADLEKVGFERTGEDHVPAKTQEEVHAMIETMIANTPEGQVIDENLKRQLYGWYGNNPYVEGAWMTKYNGLYYFQFATPGTEFNTYADAVCIGKSPLGPFTLANNNPFSYKPGGFACGAGHGSTMKDMGGNWWHASTMRISNNHNFERRVGLWRAGFDDDGELFCDQRYGDWPMSVEARPWDKPEMMLLSYGKTVVVSSGQNEESITDENIKTYWQAESNSKDENVVIDLGKEFDIRAIQINFNDSHIMEAKDGMEFSFNGKEFRSIDTENNVTSFLLEAAGEDGVYEIIWDNRNSQIDLANNFKVWEDGVNYRFLRLSQMELPYGQKPCVSGIRVFGHGNGSTPSRAYDVKAILLSETPEEAVDMEVSFKAENYVGANILWGHSSDKLYHSYMIFGKESQVIRALVKNSPVYVRVDTFNESGICEGEVIKVR